MFSFHSDLSMNNITELPADVFKNFPYLEELWVQTPPPTPPSALFLLPNGVLTLLADNHLDVWVCIAKRTPMPFLSAEGR